MSSLLLRLAGRRLTIVGDHVCLDRRRLFILPTGAGVTYAVLVVVLLLVAMNYNNSMAFAFTFLLAGIGINAMWQTHRNLLGLCINVRPPIELYAQREHTLQLSFATGHRIRHALEVEFALPYAHSSAIELSATDNVQAALRLPPMPRGPQKMPPLRIASRFPLGLFRVWSVLPFPTRLLVYPEPAARPTPLPNAPASTDTQFGNGSSEGDFQGLRDYRSTDPPRRIAWRASARSDKLLSKTLHVGAAHSLWLDWHALQGRDAEERLSVLCRWILDADQLGLRYGLRLPNQRLAPDRGTRHRHECLRLLALHGHART